MRKQIEVASGLEMTKEVEVASGLEVTNDVSVIICAYTEERWSDLGAAVASIQQQNTPPREIIVVIDHNKPLFERARAEFSGVLVIENGEPKGISGARNSGGTVAQGTLIAFLDDDAVAEPDWLELLCACCKDGQVLGVGGVVEPLWSVKLPTWFPGNFIGWSAVATSTYLNRQRWYVIPMVAASAFDEPSLRALAATETALDGSAPIRWAARRQSSVSVPPSSGRTKSFFANPAPAFIITSRRDAPPGAISARVATRKASRRLLSPATWAQKIACRPNARIFITPCPLAFYMD